MDDLITKLTAIKTEKDAHLLPGNIKKDVTVLGVTGTYTSDADATASDIQTGKTAYVNGVKLTGAMTNNGQLTYTPSDVAQSIPAGYTTGGTVNAADITVLNDYQTCDALADTILGNGGYKITDGLRYELETFLYQQRDIDTGVTQASLSSAYTIFISIKPHSWNNYRGVIGYHGGNDGRGISGFQYVDGTIGYDHIGTGSSLNCTSYISTLNQRYDMIITYENNKMSIWCNGTKIHNDVYQIDIRPFGNVRLGRAYNDSNRYFDGEMGYCYIYNRCLTSTEIEMMQDYIENL